MCAAVALVAAACGASAAPPPGATVHANGRIGAGQPRPNRPGARRAAGRLRSRRHRRSGRAGRRCGGSVPGGRSSRHVATCWPIPPWSPARREAGRDPGRRHRLRRGGVDGRRSRSRGARRMRAMDVVGRTNERQRHPDTGADDRGRRRPSPRPPRRSTVVEGGTETRSHADTVTAYLDDHVAFITVVTDPGSPHPQLGADFANALMVKTVAALRG